MKKIIIFSLGACLAFSAFSWPKCESFVNKYGRNAVTCWNELGPAPKEALINYGTPIQKGDIRRVMKNSDGSVSVERYGHEGEREEYRQTSPGTWERQ